MALSDLAVYSEYAYTTMTEVLDQQINLFNAASNGMIQLGNFPHQGDFSDKVFFAKIDGLVRRRNAYGSGSVAEKNLSNLVDTMVKVAAGTPPVRMDKGQFNWIQQNPEVAGAVLGQQLAIETMADMLNTGIGVLVAAMIQEAEIYLDVSGNTAPDDLLTFQNQVSAVAKFGDASSRILGWVMHSKPMHDLMEKNVTNAERLFVFGTVNVMRDPFGRIMLMSDAPNLINTVPTPDKYHTLGLTSGALRIDQNGDYDANEEAVNGDENIKRTFQAEWSYEMGVKGFAWDKTNGGKSPTDAALMTSTNWDRVATSHKDLPGVILDTH